MESSAFKTFEHQGISLEVNDNRKIDVIMQLGEPSTRITVEAAGAQVETSSAIIQGDGEHAIPR